MLTELVEEQLSLGHIEPSFSQWNSPIFTIKKKSGKWRLLMDLRAVNLSMVPMGKLQTGLPSPVVIPKEWPLIIVDLKDCFYHIPIHPEDKKRFAFSVPSLNNTHPCRRFQWTVLPQGMLNSPTMCQFFVDKVLSPAREKFPQAMIFHYTDDILLTMNNETDLQDLYSYVIDCLQTSGLKIALEKIQTMPPYQYLGFYFGSDVNTSTKNFYQKRKPQNA